MKTTRKDCSQSDNNDIIPHASTNLFMVWHWFYEAAYTQSNSLCNISCTNLLIVYSLVLRCCTAVCWDCVSFMNKRYVHYSYLGMLSWLKSDIFFNHSTHIFCLFFHFLVVLFSETRTVMITQHSSADVFPWPQQLSTWCSNLLHNCMESSGSVFSAVLGKQIFGLPPHSISLLLQFVCTLHQLFWTGFVVNE